MIRTPIINRPASRDSRQCASDRAPLPLIFSWNCRHAGTSSPEEAAGVLHAAWVLFLICFCFFSSLQNLLIWFVFYLPWNYLIFFLNKKNPHDLLLLFFYSGFQLWEVSAAGLLVRLGLDASTPLYSVAHNSQVARFLLQPKFFHPQVAIVLPTPDISSQNLMDSSGANHAQ